ncbi:MAG: SIS domain-containing protein [Bacteroidetes bacterium]|nr:SIS domain-containing protein [Bacteroidota bacterium]MCL5026928.1 SIS domain-containing protein [Chloroflexota bacterium]
MTSRQTIDLYFRDMETIIRTISREDIDEVVQRLYRAWENEGTVYIMGNGGSASTASHFACDLAKATIVEGKRRFKVLSLVDNVPLVSAWTNDSGFDSIYAEQLEPFLRSGDVVIAISVHGGVGADQAGVWSQNLLRAVHLAKERGAVTIGFSGFDGGALKEIADACIVVPFPSTPQVESFHAALEHLICLCMRQKIEAAP